MSRTVRFRDLAVGDVFLFASQEDPRFAHSGMARGPWIKRTATTYEHVKDVGKPITERRYGGSRIRVGSIKVAVIRSRRALKNPPGTVLARGASKLEMDKIAGWMAREGVQADVEPVNGHWGITVPKRAATRARAAFQRVLRNPRGKGLPIPKGAIEFVVDKLHVGTPEGEVKALVRERIEQAVKKGAEGWTPGKIRQALDYAVKVHRRNLKLYRDVMGGRLGRGKAKGNRGGRWYYGYKIGGGVEKFWSRRKPTQRSHGHLYSAVTGPFKGPGEMDTIYGFWWQAGPHTIRRRGKSVRANQKKRKQVGRWYYAVVSRRGLWGPFATRQRAGGALARLRSKGEKGLTMEQVRRDGRDFIFKSGGRFRTVRPGERIR